MIGLDGYTIATGILDSNLNGDNIVSIPLDIDDPIELVYIQHEKTSLSKMGERFIEYLLEEVRLIANRVTLEKKRKYGLQMNTNDFDFHLPEGVDCKHLLEKRDTSSFDAVNRQTGEFQDRHFHPLLKC